MVMTVTLMPSVLEEEGSYSCACKNGFIGDGKITVQTLMNVLATIKVLIYVIATQAVVIKMAAMSVLAIEDTKIFHKGTLIK